MELIINHEPAQKNQSTVEMVKPLRSATLESTTKILSIEEKFLQFCIKYLESPEREGKLPIEYSKLKIEDIKKVTSSHNSPPSEGSPQNQETELLHETVETIDTLNKESSIAIVKELDDVANPLGEIADATLFFISDEHETPSSINEGIRAKAFKRYAPERVVGSITDFIKRVRTRQGLEQIDFQTPEYSSDKDIPSPSVTNKHIQRTDSRFLFNRWIIDYISKRSSQDRFTDKNSTPIIIRTGDQITDGATLSDQLGVEGDYFRMLSEINNSQGVDAKMVSIYGNHDQDSRIPESVTMLSEIFGQKIFYQEIGSALIVALDTNIENPVWVSDFLKRSGEDGKTALELKRKCQEAVLQKMLSFTGEIAIIGHHPSRMIDSYGVKTDTLQKSNVVCVIGGHTHSEDHIETPLKNKNGKPIALHVFDSTLKTDKNGNPLPSKSYSINISNGQIGVVKTLQETQESFTARYKNLQLEKDII